MKRAFTITLISILFFQFGLNAQSSIEKNISIEIDSVFSTPSNWPLFTNSTEKNDISYYQDISSINSRVTTVVEIQDEVWVDVERPISKVDISESDRILHMTEEGGRNLTIIRTLIHPFRKLGAQWQYLKSCKLIIYYDPAPAIPQSEVLSSELQEGDIFKFAVSEEGFYKIDRNYLSNLSGIDVGNLDPKNVKVLGLPGGMLNEAVRDIEYKQLVEVPLFFKGNNNATIESEEFFVLYAYGADRWSHSNGSYGFNSNVYDRENYYFVKISQSERTELPTSDDSINEEISFNSFDRLYRQETNQSNLLYESPAHYGSGQMWFGDYLGSPGEISLDDIELVNRIDNSPVNIKLGAAARSSSGPSIFLKSVGQTLTSRRFSSVSTSSLTSTYADYETLSAEWNKEDNRIPLEMELRASSGNAWLDYVQASYNSSLKYSENIKKGMRFSNSLSLGYDVVKFELEELPTNSLIMRVSSNSDYMLYNGSEIIDENQGQVHFYAVADLDALEAPSSADKLTNIDILEDVDFDYLIVYHEKFKTEAERLADHRRIHSGLKVKIVNIDDVYNEFSSGRIDPSSIRNYASYLYGASQNFNYLLLFGGGTFDMRNTYEAQEKLSYIPTFQTNYSLSPIGAFPSDDYFGLLTEEEGGNISSGSIDIGVGRLPVNTISQARIIVDKLLEYDLAEESIGEWRTYCSFMADDEDGNLHYNQAEGVARANERNYRDINTDKIYFDAFEQVSTSGGPRYPDAKEALKNHLDQGRLTVCYLGHGSYRGLSQERVVVSDDMTSWNNRYRYPLFVTATCSFSAFDDPSFYSAGELSFLKENGGNIGLFTTTRLVYSSPNKELTESIFSNIFKRDNTGIPLRLGDVLRLAKNENIGENTRKFSLLGDPAMRLAIPIYKVSTTHINGADVESSSRDTINALGEIDIRGTVTDFNDNILTDFNGEIVVTLFDKVETLKTLGQDNGSYESTFDLRKRILFKGRASVQQGAWSINFTLPQDIDFNIGTGKLSYYAFNAELEDAMGSYEDLYIGGINPEAESDETGPEILVFMNDDKFRSGGITNSDPKLFVKLSDDQGINVSTSGLGHEPVGVLDGSQQYELQNFYKSNLDDPRSGTISYPLSNLASGRHKITVKAWDLSNNSGEGETEFIVVENDERLIDHLFNGPNPMNDFTNFSFEHSLGEFSGDIYVDIYSVSGQLMKTIEVENFQSQGYRVDNIRWHGDDENKNILPNGIYFYRVRILLDGEFGETFESDTKKLVLVK